MSDHADLFARAEMRWMSVESSEMKVRARTIAEIGREMASLVAERDEARQALREAESERDVIAAAALAVLLAEDT